MSKQIKITCKIPEELFEVIKYESEKYGVGIQRIAGKIMIHGYNSLIEKQAELQKDKKDV